MWPRWRVVRNRGLQLTEDVLELRRKGRVEAESLAGHRMVERQMFRMEEEPGQVRERRAMAAIAAITDDGMADRLEMHSDLVRAAGVE